MRRIGTVTLYLYRHRFVRYLFVGGTTFLIDFGLLYFLHNNLLTTVTFATSIAYWISITYNFALNRSWTFEAWENKSLKRHISTYFFLLVANYLFVLIFVAIFSNFIHFILAKAIAVLIQTTWTYYLYKHHIFIANKKSQHSVDEN
jgi:putative flippase GtrA